MRTPRFIVAIALLAIVIPAKADWLIVSKNANIRAGSSGSAEIRAKAKAGDTLILLSDTQQNGYFNVRPLNSNTEGWVYRTLVRRYTGELPPDAGTSSGDLKIDVLDVGAGLCVVASLPGDKFIIYDAGDNGVFSKSTLPAIEKIIPAKHEIEQLIISHNDGDHIYAADDIINTYRVKEFVFTGYDKSKLGKTSSTSYTNMINAEEKADYPIEVINLNEEGVNIIPGTTYTYGEVKLVYLCGFGSPPDEWGLKDEAEKLNSVSIVVKLVYKGVSVLLAGDAVGRHREDTNQNALIATEKYLVDNAGTLLKSNIIIAPHHGGNNGSSTAFINKVSPSYVIFSAGHDNHHPTQAAADRYLKTVSLDNMFRTDRGDDEGDCTKCCPEWSYGKIPGCKDPIGDDEVEIIIKGNGTYSVKYLQPDPGCIGGH